MNNLEYFSLIKNNNRGSHNLITSHVDEVYEAVGEGEVPFGSK